MTTGRPPISPCPDREPPVLNGLGADERRFEDDSEFPCNVRSDQDAIFGMEDSTGEELRASDEGEQAAQIAPLPTPFQLTLSQCLGHRVTHYPYWSGCPYCVEGRGREFGHSRVVKESTLR